MVALTTPGYLIPVTSILRFTYCLYVAARQRLLTEAGPESPRLKPRAAGPMPLDTSALSGRLACAQASTFVLHSFLAGVPTAIALAVPGLLATWLGGSNERIVPTPTGYVNFTGFTSAKWFTKGSGNSWRILEFTVSGVGHCRVWLRHVSLPTRCCGIE